MILTCPDCATRYFVDDAKVAPEGRAVRCAACGTRWTAKPADNELELRVSPELGAIGEERKKAPPQPEKSLPQKIRQKHVEKTNVRKAMTHGIVWATMVGILVVALGLSVVFRAQVVAFLPRSASAYAMVGMPVNATGLALEDVSAAAGLQDGHSALMVSGAVRNIEDHVVHAPKIDVAVIDGHGKVIKRTRHTLPDGEIPAGEARHFVFAVLNPPAEAKDVEVTFALSAPKAARAKGHGEEAHGEEAAHGHEHDAPALRAAPEVQAFEELPQALPEGEHAAPADGDHAEEAHAAPAPAPKSAAPKAVAHAEPAHH